MSNGIDPTVNPVEAARSDPASNRSPIETKRGQLPPGDHPMLARGQLGECAIAWMIFCTVAVPKHIHVGHEPEDGAPCVTDQRAAVTKVARPGIEPEGRPEGSPWEPVRTESWMARAGIEPATP